jgi:hypothetical protein
VAFKLEKNKTKTAPHILIDEEKGYMRIEGESFLEDIRSFFRDVDEWLAGYLSSGNGDLTFDCAMGYFNSSTTKVLYSMLRRMDKYAVAGRKITVNWIAEARDDIVIECGEDFKKEMENLEFNLKIKSRGE